METKNINIEPIKKTTLRITLVGDSDLILHKKARSFERLEVFKQSHDKGTDIPQIYTQSKNPWEALITSITWLHPIEFHDDDWSKYTEEEWNNYMANNKPCILAQAFYGSFMECFVTFYKEKTKKNGTDFKRAVNIVNQIIPIDFVSVETESKLVPNGGISNTNVLCQQNVFHGWSCTLELTVADIVFPYKTILSIIQTAGEFIGISTQRKNGYGRFHIEGIQII